jgi:Putative auto-transporter adhesin, head GIN domain
MIQEETAMFKILRRSIVLIALTFPAMAHAANDHRNFLVGNFEEVSVEGDLRVEITNNGPPSARAEGDAKLVDSLKFERIGKLVRIRFNPVFNVRNIGPNGNLIVKLTGRNIRKLSLRGSGSITIDAIKTPLGQFDIRGPGEIRLGSLQTEKMQLLMNGAGKFTLSKGTATQGALQLNGTAQFDAPEFNFGNLTLFQQGAASTVTRVNREATITNAGPGTITITGSGSCVIRQAGTAQITCPTGKPTR